MFSDISKKSLQVTINNAEFAMPYFFMISCEIEGETIKRRSDISNQVASPIFVQNKFFLPLNEQNLQMQPKLIIKAFVLASRLENVSEAELYGQARQLGQEHVELTSILPELVDNNYGPGLRRKVEFKRMRDGEEANSSQPIVGRAFVDLKIVGDYLTKFDSIGDGKKGAPKKSLGEFHVLPNETANFNWRMRCDVVSAENMPLNDAA